MFIIYFEDLGSRLFWDPDMKFVHTASDEVIHFWLRNQHFLPVFSHEKRLIFNIITVKVREEWFP